MEKDQKAQSKQEKLEYTPPKLEEHGNVEEVTLQTFFGTFSPPAAVGSQAVKSKKPSIIGWLFVDVQPDEY